MKIKTDTVFYRIGQWILIPAIMIGVWFAHFGYADYHHLFECSFYRLTSMPCPGCGGTRAVYYFFKGDFFKSFQYHPVIIYGILAYLHFMMLYFYRNYSGVRKVHKEIQIPIYFYLAIVVILVQWLVKILVILL